MKVKDIRIKNRIIQNYEYPLEPNIESYQLDMSVTKKIKTN
jgi:hypothetical protein